MTDEQLRAWAELHPAMPQAAAVLRLMREREEERAEFRATIGGLVRLVNGMGERIDAQSELLRRRAGRRPVLGAYRAAFGVQ